MYKRRDKNTNFHIVHIAQTKCSIKHISNIYGGVINIYPCSNWLKREREIDNH